MTQRLARSLVIFLWLLPFGLILVTFSAFPKQGFLSENCEGHEFLMRLPFRAAYSIMILIPTVGKRTFLHKLLNSKSVTF